MGEEFELTAKIFSNIVDLIQEMKETCDLHLNVEFKEGVIMESYFSIGVRFGEELQNIAEQINDNDTVC